MKKYKIIKGYTIVEILVVLIILVILGTIGFISYTGYLVGVRDTSRKVDLDNIGETLSTYNINKGIYPSPSNPKNIKFLGTKIWTQGDFGDSVVEQLEGSKSYVVDPLTNTYYTYSVTDTRKEYQLAAALESDEEIVYNGVFVNSAHASSKKLGKSLVIGNYNGQIKYFSTGGTDYIIALPSIITNDLSNTDLAHIIASGSLVYNNFYNLPASYSETIFNIRGGFDYVPNEDRFVIFSGSIDDFEDEYYRLAFIYDLKESYSGTILEGIGSINDLVTSEINLNDPGIDVSNMACDIIEYNLNYPIDCDYKSFLTFYLLEDDVIGTESDDSGLEPEGSGEGIPLTIDLSILDGKTIYTIYKDLNANVWFGTNDGVYVFKDGEWNVFNTSDKIPDNKIFVINGDSDGVVWFGTFKGLSRFNGDFDLQDWQIYNENNATLSSRNVVSIYVDNSGYAWIGTHNGVSVLNSDGVNIANYIKIPSIKERIGHVNSIAEDGDSGMWFGTDRGLFRKNGTNWYYYKDELLSQKVSSVFAGNNDIIWVGTEGGLSKYDLDNDEWTNYNSDNIVGFIWDSVNSVFQQNDGTLWLGTNQGVIKVSSDFNTWTPYPKDETGEIIYAIYDDGNFKILGTNEDGTTYEID